MKDSVCHQDTIPFVNGKSLVTMMSMCISNRNGMEDAKPKLVWVFGVNVMGGVDSEKS